MGNSVPSGNFELEADAAAAAKNITRTQSSLRVIGTPLVAIGPLTAHEMEFFGTLHPKSDFFIVSSSGKTPEGALSDLMDEPQESRRIPSGLLCRRSAVHDTLEIDLCLRT
jgi:hypothetical protein